MSGYRYIVPLTGELTAGRELLGGKGYNLQRLIYGNFRVPGGFVLTTLAFRKVLGNLVRAGRGWDGADAFAAAFRETPLPEDVEQELASAWRKLLLLGSKSVVVRSSATLEDSESSSMAGQAASFVNVLSFEQLREAVKRCWASIFSRESIIYRSCLVKSSPYPEMAVVVQQFVPSQRAGVLFTVDPVSGETGQYLVSATWGLGEMVVAGRASDTAYLDPASGRILRQEVVRKAEKIIPSPDGGTRVVPVSRDQALRPVLDLMLARGLSEMGRGAQQFFGAHLDIEWGEHDGRLYLFQARPVTTVRKASCRTVWSNANVGEALPGVGTPFTWSIIESFSKEGLTHAFKGLGCKFPPEYSIVGRVRGRVYLNLSEFMSVVSQIPFISPEHLQQLGGGGGVEELPGTYRRLPRAGFFVRLPLTVAGLLATRAALPARVALWSRRFKQYLNEMRQTRLADLDNPALCREWHRVNNVFEETGAVVMECSGQFLLDYVLTSLVLKLLLGPTAMKIERELFSGLSGVRSAEPGLDLLRMARRLEGMPDLKRKVLNTPPDRLIETLAKGNERERLLLSAIEAFLRSHGHRAVREAELSEPRWSEDPTFPLTVLAKYVSSPNLADPEAMIRSQIRRREEITRTVLSMVPALLRPFFRRLLKQAQEAARVREEMRNAAVQTIGLFRMLALESGRRMVKAGMFSRIDDVFFLRKDEILDWLNGRRSTEQLALFAGLRRLEHEALAGLPDLPPWFVMEGDRIVQQHPEVTTGLVLSGLPGSPGVVTGRVAVVKSPGEQAKLKPGDILVAPFTDVGWTPLFLVASAVVTELGGPLTHSCVVAREYGIPAVVNVKNATTILHDGETVTVDGDRGTVTVKR